jgi:uncharacterized protein YoxC
MADEEKKISIVAEIKANFQSFQSQLKQMMSETKKMTDDTKGTSEKIKKSMQDTFGKGIPDSVQKASNAINSLSGILKTFFPAYAVKNVFNIPVFGLLICKAYRKYRI